MTLEEEMAELSGPHVTRAWFGEFDLPSGFSRLHDGVGRVTANGHEWRGVSDPLGAGTLVSIEAVDDPRFGQAAAVRVILSGVNVAFWKSVKADARAIEGRTATLYRAIYDPETVTLKHFKAMLPGKMSSPSVHHQGPGVRFVGLTIEGFWQSQNFPFGGRWNYADQLRRFPGDKGGQYISQKVAEKWI